MPVVKVYYSREPSKHKITFLSHTVRITHTHTHANNSERASLLGYFVSSFHKISNSKLSPKIEFSKHSDPAAPWAGRNVNDIAPTRATTDRATEMII